MAADLAASWRPELRDGADGVIDRSQDARHSAGPNGGSTPRTCLELASRNPSWQRSCVTASTDRTYDRKRSDPHAASPLASRGPSTYGSPPSRGRREGRSVMLLVLQVVTATLVSIAIALALAHALELPGKLRLTEQTYRAVQTIYYPGFSLGGLAERLGLISLLRT